MVWLLSTPFFTIAASWTFAHYFYDYGSHQGWFHGGSHKHVPQYLEFEEAFPSFQVPDSQPPPSRSGGWLGWGADLYNNRWAAPDAIVSSTNVESLELVCEQQYNPGVSAAPLIQDGVAYYPTWSGLLVALDYQRCKVLWETNITKIIVKYKPLDPIQLGIVVPISRSTPAADGNVLYIGTLAHALVLALDKSNGKLIDSLQLSDHPFASLTQSPTVYKGKIYYGVSSLEEGAADLIEDYPCCSFIGTMNAATLRHGRLRLVWTQAMIPSGLNFSGSAIWGSQPAIDPIRNQVFIATGNTYQLPDAFEQCQNATANIIVIQQGLTTDPCLPRNVFQEAVLAHDLDTGRINWVRQLSPLDAWNVACLDGVLFPPTGNTEQCPDTPGPDADFGMAPTFVLGSEYTPDGLDIVVVGQKNGNLYGMSATSGTLLWATVTSPDGFEGGLIWGMAVDDQAIYYTAVNSERKNYTLPGGDGKTTISNSAFGAARLKDGQIIWQTASPRDTMSLVTPSVANDIVLTGSTGAINGTSPFPVGPGSLVALNKHTGQVVAEVILDSYFQGGIAPVHDYVMFGTGYAGLHPAAAGTFQVRKIKSQQASAKKSTNDTQSKMEL